MELVTTAMKPTKQTNKLLRIKPHKREGKQAYLLELFDIYVELTSKFSLCVGERGNLGTQGTAAGSFTLRSAALFFIFGSQALDLGVLAAKECFVVQFASFVFFAECFQFGAEAVPVVRRKA